MRTDAGRPAFEIALKPRFERRCCRRLAFVDERRVRKTELAGALLKPRSERVYDLLPRSNKFGPVSASPVNAAE